MSKVLECSSKGDKRFSAFYAVVSVKGVSQSIESHYQKAKRFDGKELSVKMAKGKKPSSIVVNDKEFGVEYLSIWYKLLWVMYFYKNKELLEYIEGFDEFNDMFKGKSLNCQADVIREIKVKGWNVVYKECKEFIELIK